MLLAGLPVLLVVQTWRAIDQDKSVLLLSVVECLAYWETGLTPWRFLLPQPLWQGTAVCQAADAAKECFARPGAPWMVNYNVLALASSGRKLTLKPADWRSYVVYHSALVNTMCPVLLQLVHHLQASELSGKLSCAVQGCACERCQAEMSLLSASHAAKLGVLETCKVRTWFREVWSQQSQDCFRPT